MSNLDEILSVIEELEQAKRSGTTVGTINEDDLLKNILKKKYGEKSISQSRSNAPSKSKTRVITREVLGQLHKDKEYLSSFINRSGKQRMNG